MVSTTASRPVRPRPPAHGHNSLHKDRRHRSRAATALRALISNTPTRRMQLEKIAPRGGQRKNRDLVFCEKNCGDIPICPAPLFWLEKDVELANSFPGLIANSFPGLV